MSAGFVPCPKCQQENSAEALECARCGIIFSRYKPTPDPVQPAAPLPSVAPTARVQEAPPSLGLESSEPVRSFSISPKWILLFLGALVVAYAVWRPTYIKVGPDASASRQGLILLHGKGADAAEFVPLAEQISAHAPNVSMLVLKAPHGTAKGRAWQTGGDQESSLWQISQSEEMIIGAIEDLESAGIPSSEIYLAGFSHGAQMALHAAAYTNLERKIGGVILMSGKLPDWNPSVSKDALRAENFSDGFRVLVTHGVNDDIVNWGGSKQIVGLLDDTTEVTHIEYRGGHDIPPDVALKIGEFLQAGN